MNHAVKVLKACLQNVLACIHHGISLIYFFEYHACLVGGKSGNHQTILYSKYAYLSRLAEPGCINERHGLAYDYVCSAAFLFKNLLEFKSSASRTRMNEENLPVPHAPGQAFGNSPVGKCRSYNHYYVRSFKSLVNVECGKFNLAESLYNPVDLYPAFFIYCLDCFSCYVVNPYRKTHYSQMS